MTTVFVSGSFDDLRSRHVRLLEEASKLGDLHVLLWADEIAAAVAGTRPKFPQEERLYLLRAIRYVNQVTPVTALDAPDALPAPVLDAAATAAPATPAPALKRRAEDAKGAEAPSVDTQTDAGVLWAVDEADDTADKRAFCAARGIAYRVFTTTDLRGFPGAGGQGLGAGGLSPAVGGQQSVVGSQPSSSVLRPSSVLVTGCYDWLHSGHVRFFEEASAYGDLIVVVGNDANVRHLKGEGHPLQTQDERRYMVGSIRYVKLALISTGWDWLDAEPEIERLKPDIYLVNEDGDKPEKREYCATHGLQYVVLKRMPKQGLPRRSSTDLRGF